MKTLTQGGGIVADHDGRHRPLCGGMLALDDDGRQAHENGPSVSLTPRDIFSIISPFSSRRQRALILR